MKRTVIIIQGPRSSGKTTLASLIATSGDWQVVDFNPHNLVGVRDLVNQPKLIICCTDIDAKKFHNWWSVVLADAQVFFWKIAVNSIVLKKPSTITFKNKF
jgi:hypothetical protein